MDRKFWVDEKCNQCSLCSKVCPVQNIALQGGNPTWNHRCEQCFACLQWCPQGAIQYGKKRPNMRGQCSICSKVSVENITLQEGKRTRNQRCEQCFACLQWCPQEAIQYGKKTPQYD